LFIRDSKAEREQVLSTLNCVRNSKRNEFQGAIRKCLNDGESRQLASTRKLSPSVKISSFNTLKTANWQVSETMSENTNGA
jgi:hypothetical protein